MKDIMTQEEIDKLIKYMDADMLQQWIKYYSNSNSNLIIYGVEDYDLFYCKYPLEELTSNLSVLRRYAYGDNHSFKEFKYFAIVEDYRIYKINAVSVVGIPLDVVYSQKSDYDIYLNMGTVYLTDISCLYPFLKIDKNVDI